MPSNPLQVFEDDGDAPYTGQLDPTPHSNRPVRLLNPIRSLISKLSVRAVLRPSRAALRAPYAATTSRPSSTYNSELSDTVIEHDRPSATRIRTSDIQLPSRRDAGIVMHDPVNRLPIQPVPKRKWGDGAPGSARRLHSGQRKLSIGPSISSESGRGRRGSITGEDFICGLPELVSSSARLSIHSGSINKSAVVQGVRSKSPSGFFDHASNNVFHQPIMVDNSQHMSQHDHTDHTQGDQPDGTLLWLEDYIMKGAEFDSSDRDPPPRCHPNTRASIIGRVLGWAHDPRRERKMRWMRGTAGVGKSAIIQTVFESLPEDMRGGSVFFSKPNGRNNPNQVFPSFAYQLAVRNLSYRAYLKELMLKDPRSLRKSMKEQFRILFEEPFGNQKLLDGETALVIALDGLDECSGDPRNGGAGSARSRGRSSESAQREIVELISGFIQQHASVPLIWIIASRPEKHLQVTFASEKVEPTFIDEEVPVDTVEACQDVERYLNSEFTRIREDHDDLISTTPWPSSKDFTLITTKASGLFIFAEVVIRFIDDANPIQRLKYALAAISKASLSELVENPLIFLDAMYVEIVSRVPRDLLEPATEIIGTIILLDQKDVRKDDAPLPMICNVLNISKDVALTALRHLHSVLFFPKEVVSTRPSFYHASFREFLEDESRSHEYSINEVKIGDDLAEGLMRFYRKDSFDDESLPWPRNQDSCRLAEMANSLENLISLLHFQITLFFTTFHISETPKFLLLLIRDSVIDLSSMRGLFFIFPNLKAIAYPQLGPKYEELGITYRRPINSLGITRSTISKSYIVFEGPCYTVFLHAEPRCPRESARIVAVRELLSICVELDPRKLVVVWGRDQFKRFVILPSLLDDWSLDPQMTDSSRRRISMLSQLVLSQSLLLIGF